jgi:hypothetical protein
MQAGLFCLLGRGSEFGRGRLLSATSSETPVWGQSPWDKDPFACPLPSSWRCCLFSELLSEPCNRLRRLLHIAGVRVHQSLAGQVPGLWTGRVGTVLSPSFLVAELLRARTLAAGQTHGSSSEDGVDYKLCNPGERFT